MSFLPSNRFSFAIAGFAAISLVSLIGCAGPNVTVTPRYEPPQQPAVAANKTAVRVEVVDSRVTKPQTRPDGREVLAEGDKGKVFLSRPAPEVVKESMTSALTAAGFQVNDAAPITVEVDLVELPLEAYQFTHWNLPSERASTLDALGAIVPGPVRETRAKASFNIVIRKHDARLGFSHIVGGLAANTSADSSVVEQTLSQAISKAVNDAVAQSAPDVDIVTRTPVTRKEIDGREEELLAQQKEISTLHDMLAQRETSLTEDRKAMDDMRRSLLEDKQKQEQSLAADRKALDDQRAAIEQDRAALKAKAAELSEKPKDDAQAKAALADVAKRQADLDANAAAVKKKGDDLESQARSLDERDHNLTAYAGRLDDQARANKSLSDELAARTKDLTDREAALEGWKKDVEARVAAKPPMAIVEKRHPLIIITDPTASHTETTLPQITVSGMAIDDRHVADLHASINGQPIPASAMASADESGHGVGIRTTPVASGTDGGQSLAARRIGFTAPLKEGANEIAIEAVNDDQLTTTQKLSVIYDKGAGRIHIIAIGINDYQDANEVPPLHYAVADAQDMASAFEKFMANAPSLRVRELLNRQATRASVARQLFEELPSEVRPSDTVVIFFSGHGAPDFSTDAKGNVETFLLPIDADPQHLFSTAIRMNDVGTILRRLSSERIIFIADTCYSGAATAGLTGARTVSLPAVAMRGGVGIKAIPDRPTGKGVAVMTAATGTQVAQERADVHHGIFTHFLLEGLSGAADANHDGKVTVDELYDYVRESVSKATDGKQVPQISRDPTAGEIVLSQLPRSR